jgi:hypothetical protein
MAGAIRFGQEVVDRLLADVPEFREEYEEHLRFMDGELLLHVLFGDLTRFLVAAEAADDEVLVARCLASMDRLLREADQETQNLVRVSFVENLAWEDDAVSDRVRQRSRRASPTSFARGVRGDRSSARVDPRRYFRTGTGTVKRDTPVTG